MGRFWILVTVLLVPAMAILFQNCSPVDSATSHGSNQSSGGTSDVPGDGPGPDWLNNVNKTTKYVGSSAVIHHSRSGNYFFVYDFTGKIHRFISNAAEAQLAESIQLGSSTGTRATAMTLNSNESVAYICFHDRIQSVDLSTGEVNTLSSPELGSGVEPYFLSSLAISATGDFLYALDAQRKSILEINPINGDRRIVSGPGIGVGEDFDSPRNMIWNSDGNGFYVADFNYPGIFHVDLLTQERTLVSAPTVGSGETIYPFSIAGYDPTNQTLIVLAGSGTFKVRGFFEVNTATGDRTKIIDIDYPLSTAPVVRNNNVQEVALTPDFRFAYLPDRRNEGRSSDILSFDMQSGDQNMAFEEPFGTGPVLEYCRQIELNPSGDNLFCLENDALKSVNLLTSNRELLIDGFEFSSFGNGSSVSAEGFAVSRDGTEVYVYSRTCLIKVVLSSGQKTELYCTSFDLNEFSGAYVRPDGSISILESNHRGSYVLHLVNPDTASNTEVSNSSSSNEKIHRLFHLGQNGNFAYGLYQEGQNVILKIDLRNGSIQQLQGFSMALADLNIAHSGYFLFPSLDNEDLVYFAEGGEGRLFQINLNSGVYRLISENRFGVGLKGGVIDALVFDDTSDSALIWDSSTSSIYALQLSSGSRVLVSK